MTASQATNETRLPRPVLRMSEALREKFESKPAPAVDPATPAAEAATTAVEQPQAGDPRESDVGYWKQRFKVTEGVLRAERERSQTAIGALRQQVSDLQEQVRSLQAAKPTEEKIDITAYFTPDQIEQFGEEHCQAMAEAAQRASKKQVQEALEAELKPLKERRKAEDDDAVQDRQRRFYDALAAEVPDYLEIDQTDGWREWLAQEDPATGMVRQEVLNAHAGSQNAAKVAKMFKQYLKESKPKTPEPPIAPHGTATNAGGSSNDNPAPAQGAPNRVEIKDYYRRAALGKVSGAERASFEARLRLAHGA